MSSHLDRTQMLMDVHRPKEAVRVLLDSLAAEPNDAHVHAMLARCYLELKQLRDARRQIEQSIQLAPDEAYGHYIHSFVLRDLKRPQDARRTIDEALNLSPNVADYFSQSANLWISDEKYQEAIRDAERGLEIDSLHVECGCNLAFALMCSGKKVEADEALRKILVEHPDHARVHATYGWVAYHSREYHSARQHFTEALRIDPEYKWAETGLRDSLYNNAFWRVLAAGNAIMPDSIWSAFSMILLFRFLYTCVWLGPWLPDKHPEPSTPEKQVTFFLVMTLVSAFGLIQLIGKPLAELRLAISSQGRRLMTRHECLATITAWGVITAATALMVYGGSSRNRAFYSAGCILLWGAVPATSIWRFRRLALCILFGISAVAYFVTGAMAVTTLAPIERQIWKISPDIIWWHWLIAVSVLIEIWLAHIVEPEDD